MPPAIKHSKARGLPRTNDIRIHGTAQGRLLACLLCAAVAAVGLAAQDGSLDMDFDPGAGPNNAVFAMALQPDGKVLIGGNFTSFPSGGIIRRGIARLDANGILDMGFYSGDGVDGPVHAVVLQPDGKILIGGVFEAVNSQFRNRVARLNTDGSLDMDFDPVGGPNHGVLAMALQPDGKILVGGHFTTVNGIGRQRIARLNADGSLDADFNPVGVADFSVRAMTLQPDGKILIAGDFTEVDGVERRYVARLNADGSLDASFDPGSGPDSWIYVIHVQSDGKILIGGTFEAVNGEERNRIARLNADGGLDTDFDPGEGANNTVFAIATRPDGKVLIGGHFTEVGGEERNRVARLNPDGSLDTSFDPGMGPNNTVRATVQQPDGKILIGGFFTAVGSDVRGRVARLNNPSPVITSEPLTTIGVNHAYTYSVAAGGEPAPTITVGDLPEWLTFDGVGTISGVPQESHVNQTFGPIVVTAENAWGEAVQTFHIDVVGVAPQITSIPVTSATVGFPYEYVVTATGAPTPVLSADGLPDWLTFDQATGNLSGTPVGVAVGSVANVTITATGWGEPAVQTFAITIRSGVAGGGAGAGGCALLPGSGRADGAGLSLFAVCVLLLVLCLGLAHESRSRSRGVS